MKLTEEEVDILTELINIGVGKAAGVLNQMTQLHINLHIPSVQLLTVDEMVALQKDDDSNMLSAVYLGFEGKFSGTAGIVFPTQSASSLVSTLIGEDADNDLDELKVGTLTEVGNIVVNGVMGSMSNVLEEHLDYTIPTYLENTMSSLIRSNVADEQATIMMAQTRFTIEEKNIEGEIMLIFGVGSFDALIHSMHQKLAESQ